MSSVSTSAMWRRSPRSDPAFPLPRCASGSGDPAAGRVSQQFCAFSLLKSRRGPAVTRLTGFISIWCSRLRWWNAFARTGVIGSADERNGRLARDRDSGRGMQRRQTPSGRYSRRSESRCNATGRSSSPAAACKIRLRPIAGAHKSCHYSRTPRCRSTMRGNTNDDIEQLAQLIGQMAKPERPKE